MAYIRTLSSGKYRAEIRKNHTTIKNKTFLSKREAQQWAEDFQNKIKVILNLKPKKLKKLSPDKVEQLGGLDLFKKLGVQVDFLTFRSLVNEYITQWTGKDENTLRRAEFWLNVFQDKPIKSIKQSHIEAVLERYKQGSVNGYGNNKPKSNNTLLRMKAVLSSIFNYAVERKYLEKNPTEKIRIKPQNNQMERFLSQEETQKLLSACHECDWGKMHLLILLAISTGMRKTELIYLKWSDIDFEKSLAYLADTKNGRPRLNPIPTAAMEELKKFREIGNGFIFCSPTNPEKPFDFRTRWEWVRNQAELNNFRFHDLRHSAASFLVMGGATLYEAGQILGHRSQQTTQRYAHLSVGHKSKVSEKVMSKVFS